MLTSAAIVAFLVAALTPADAGLRQEIEALNAAMSASSGRDPASVGAYSTDDAAIIGAGQRYQARRQPSGALQFAVDAYTREGGTGGEADAARVTSASLQAVESGDVKTLERIFDDQFVIISSAGAPDAREIQRHYPSIAIRRAGGRKILAQQVTPAAAPPPAETTSIAARIADVVDERYVFPDVGRRIAAFIRARAKSGAYEQLTPAQFVDVLTQDLRKENSDRHLYVQYQPGGAPSTGAGGGPVRTTPGGSLQSRELARRRNYYLNQAERLDGNVGYLDIRRFFGGTEEARAAAAAAMAFLADTDAMIVDVRYAPGGDAGMVDLIASYFFDRVTPTLHSFSRTRNETIERTTLANVPGRRRPAIPLFVLTSRDTGSAAEDFAFLLQQTGRATLVGDRTAGAGHMNAIMAVGGGYSLSVSIGRTFNPKTNQGWEGTGVQPEVRVPPADALETAHRLALSALIEKATDAGVRRELTWTRDVLDARRAPPTIDERTLQSYAGQYGTRAIHFRDHRLWYERASGSELIPLVPLSSTEFAMGEGQRFQFLASGGGIEMRLLMTDGSHLAYPRDRR